MWDINHAPWFTLMGLGGGVFSRNVCSFINVRTLPGHCHVRPRRADGIEDKYCFVRYVERLEGIWITGVPPQDIALME